MFKDKQSKKLKDLIEYRPEPRLWIIEDLKDQEEYELISSLIQLIVDKEVEKALDEYIRTAEFWLDTHRVSDNSYNRVTLVKTLMGPDSEQRKAFLPLVTLIKEFIEMSDPNEYLAVRKDLVECLMLITNAINEEEKENGSIIDRLEYYEGPLNA
jgi:hypothetical protein